MGRRERMLGVQARKPGERLQKEVLCWTSFWTFWDEWGTQR